MSPKTRDFAVGPLSFRIDDDTGMVRTIRFQGHEVLRGIYPAVRDERWRTLIPVMNRPKLDSSDAGVHLHLVGQIRSEEVEICWKADITAKRDGTLIYRWQGRPVRSFRTNRTGICVLHPASAAGASCRVEQTDGRVVAGAFPSSIAPHQPFSCIRAITHPIVAGLEATVRMDGEVFEMEDQRNWTDASFKTYCRPLDWLKPYELGPREAVVHTVTLSFAGSPSVPRTSPLSVEHAAGSLPLALPRIGFTLHERLPLALYERFRALRPAHVRVATTSAELNSTLEWARDEAEAHGCELEISVSGANEEAPVRSMLPPHSLVTLFDSSGDAAPPTVIRAWRASGHTVLGTGTCNHFTELNRNPPQLNGTHTFTTFGINAQVHAFDDESLLETLTQHAVVAAQARVLGGDRPVSIGPIVLGPAADTADPRLHSTFGALWTLGSLVQLAHANVARVTYFRAHGPGGFLVKEKITPLERLFLALAGAPRAERLVPAGAPLGVSDALLVYHAEQRRLLVAHYGESSLDVRVVLDGAEKSLHLAPRSIREFALTA